MRNCISAGTLQAWFDGELDAAEGANVAAHFKLCPRCAEAARIAEAENAVVSRGLTAEFAAAIPTERLRQRVETAVAAYHRPIVPSVSQSRWRAARDLFVPFRTFAYASIALAILLVGFIGFVYLRKDSAAPDAPKNNSASVVSPISEKPPELPGAHEPSAPRKVKKVRNSKAVGRTRVSEPDAMSLSWQQRQYDFAISQLSEAIKIQPEMRPSLRVEYEYNMAVIDNKIATSRNAARKNPKDPQAAQFMLAAYQSKVDLMNQIANARLGQ